LVSVDDERQVEAAKAACFGVGATPVLVDLSAAVSGVVPGSGTEDGRAWAAASDLIRSTIDPDEDIHATAAYRRHLTGVLAARSLQTAWSRAVGEIE
jgi:aerobic carbon-monoxide dehydrogenase medium subunit